MALRRPAPPRLRPGRPGVEPVPGSDPSSLAPSARARPARRRTVLLAGGTVAAVALPAGLGALLLGRSRARGSTSWTADAGFADTRAGVAPLSSPFADVPDDAPELAAMIWAAEVGVQPPLEDGGYGPDQPVRRGELAAVLHRFAGAPETPVDSAAGLLTDAAEDPQHAPALLWLFGRGALWCDEKLRLRPRDETTHDETVATLTALLRPALAAAGSTWDPAEADVPAADSADDAVGLRWLTAADMMPAAVAVDGWSGDASLTRVQLATVLHQANAVIVRCLV